MNDKKNLETYYDHYKETCSLSKAAQSRRNKSFVALCLLETLSFMMMLNPDMICSLLNDTIREKLETTIQFSTNILQTSLWIIIAYALIRYVQDALYVERQYTYLGKLEKKLSKLLGKGDLFCRESENYLKEYPIVLNLVDLFYKFFSPILFTIVNIIHIVEEWRRGGSRLTVMCDTAMCATIFLITWFYFFEIHSRLSSWFKRCRLINWMSIKLRKILNYV